LRLLVAEGNVLVLAVLQGYQNEATAYDQQLVGLEMVDKQIVNGIAGDFHQHGFVAGLGLVKLCHASFEGRKRADFYLPSLTHFGSLLWKSFLRIL
jgi:hypothetical protein